VPGKNLAFSFTRSKNINHFITDALKSKRAQKERKIIAAQSIDYNFLIIH
jgi:hypothetical protein